MSHHILKIKSKVTTNTNHIIAHECGHILRMMKANPPDRVVPCSTSKTIADATRDINSYPSSIPADIKLRFIDYWLDGIIFQVTNLAEDSRIERWIHDSYVGLRSSQIEYLQYNASQCLASMTKEIAMLTPPKVFLASTAMNYAYLRAIGSIMNIDYTKNFEPYPESITIGKKLYKLIETPDQGFLQDIETTNNWAKILGLTNWFSWTDFENVPEGYGE